MPFYDSLAKINSNRRTRPILVITYTSIFSKNFCDFLPDTNVIYIILLLQACGDSKKNNQRTTKNNHTVAIENNNGAYLKIDRNRHNFGKVQKSKTPIIPIKFKIENLGTVPLVILKVDVACSCMSVNYPKAPILPGGNAELIVNINTKLQINSFNKVIFIKSNAQNDVELIRISGEIRK